MCLKGQTTPTSPQLPTRKLLMTLFLVCIVGDGDEGGGCADD